MRVDVYAGPCGLLIERSGVVLKMTPEEALDLINDLRLAMLRGSEPPADEFLFEVSGDGVDATKVTARSASRALDIFRQCYPRAANYALRVRGPIGTAP